MLRAKRQAQFDDEYKWLENFVKSRQWQDYPIPDFIQLGGLTVKPDEDMTMNNFEKITALLGKVLTEIWDDIKWDEIKSKGEGVELLEDRSVFSYTPPKYLLLNQPKKKLKYGVFILGRCDNTMVLIKDTLEHWNVLQELAEERRGIEEPIEGKKRDEAISLFTNLFVYKQMLFKSDEEEMEGVLTVKTRHDVHMTWVQSVLKVSLACYHVSVLYYSSNLLTHGRTTESLEASP
jgi:hypothetical protein